MDASPPESNGSLAGAAKAGSDAVAASLEDALATLDALGHGLAACYVSAAIEMIRTGSAE